MRGGRHYKGIILLTLLLAGVPLLAWQAALSSTFKTSREIRGLKKNIAANATLFPSGTGQVRVASAEDLITDGLVLDRIAGTVEANGIRIVEYQPYTNEHSGGLTLLSAEITVTGSYTDVIRIIDTLENEVPECVVKSVGFSRVEERRERTISLKAVIVIQQLITG